MTLVQKVHEGVLMPFNNSVSPLARAWLTTAQKYLTNASAPSGSPFATGGVGVATGGLVVADGLTDVVGEPFTGGCSLSEHAENVAAQTVATARATHARFVPRMALHCSAMRIPFVQIEANLWITQIRPRPVDNPGNAAPAP